MKVGNRVKYREDESQPSGRIIASRFRNENQEYKVKWPDQTIDWFSKSQLRIDHSGTFCRRLL